jgi:hypothetical protein
VNDPGSDPGGGEERLFSLEEATALLPDLREELTRMREARQVILRSGERVRESVTGNGGGAEGKAYQEAAALLRDGVERISSQGIILRDVESGLIDFPSDRDGRVVYLCWRLGEDRIGFWHPPETGFPGRQPL